MIGVVLAGGRNRRFGGERPKFLEPFRDEPMVRHVVSSMAPLVEKVFIVTGAWEPETREALSEYDNVEYVPQSEPLGTGHAVLAIEGHVSGDATLLISFADKPFVTEATFRVLVDHHSRSGADITLSTAMMGNPRKKGRVIRDPDGRFHRIVETRDAGPEELAVKEVHAGFICAQAGELFRRLHLVRHSRHTHEIYLTAVYELYLEAGLKVETAEIPALTCFDVNTPSEFDELQKLQADEAPENDAANM